MNGRRLIPAFATFLLITAPQASAHTPGLTASCGHGTRTLAAASSLTQYDDYIEDAGAAPDFCASELVTNDNESVTIGIHVHNRDGFVAGDEYTALLDTGAAKYELSFDGAGAQLKRWSGTDYVAVPATVPMDWLDGYGPVLDILRADLGNPTSIDVVLESTSGTDSDRAPDSGAWAYRVTPLALSVHSLKLTPARAGGTFSARAVVMRNDWEIPLDEGRIACTARIGSHAFRGLGTFAHDNVVCTWRLPRNAAGRRLTGSVAVTFEGVKAARSFAVRVG